MGGSVASLRTLFLSALGVFAASGGASSAAQATEPEGPPVEVLERNVPLPEVPVASSRRPRTLARHRPLVELVRPASGESVVLERASRILAELGAQGLEVLVRTCAGDEPTCATSLPPLSQPGPLAPWVVVARVIVDADPRQGVHVESGTSETTTHVGRAAEVSDDPAALAIQVGEIVHGLSLAADERWRREALRAEDDVSQVPDDELPPEPPLSIPVPAPRVTGTVGWAVRGHSGSLDDVVGPLFALRWRRPRGWGARAAGVWMLQPKPLAPNVQLGSHVDALLELERWFGQLSAGVGGGVSYLSAGTAPLATSSGWVWSALLSGRIAVQFPALSRLRGEVGVSAFLVALPVVFHQGASVVSSTGRWGSLLWVGWDLG